MAGLAHLGFGFAAKRMAPGVPLGVLLVGAEVLDFASMGFMAAGIERMPAQGVPGSAIWSHGLVMSLAWALAAGLVMFLVNRNIRNAVVMSLAVGSHWILDAITHPMRAVYPFDTGIPVFFSDTPAIGLGLWTNPIVTYAGEFLILGAGVAIYVFALKKIRREKMLGGK